MALTATGMLAACGGNDSTASSTPSVEAPSTTVKPSASATTSAPTSAGGGRPTPQQQPAPQQPAQPPSGSEQPQAITSSPPPPQLTDKDKAYLAALSSRGVTPSSPDIAIAAANYICTSQSHNVNPLEIRTYVTAMAGSDPGFDPHKMPVEQVAQTYLDTANQSYCGK
ncbi:MAG: DUF732 domain-containing protein [Nocardia sp.]|nr:DUF732 domain-containing protein [Nocardia sp.]